MGTEAPTIVTIPVSCAPKKAPCPTCGRPGRRTRILPPRRVRTVAYQAIAYLEITCGEYRARCDCCTTFRSTPEGVLPTAGPHLEPGGGQDRGGETTPSPPAPRRAVSDRAGTSLSRVRTWWCSARSVEKRESANRQIIAEFFPPDHRGASCCPDRHLIVQIGGGTGAIDGGPCP